MGRERRRGPLPPVAAVLAVGGRGRLLQVDFMHEWVSVTMHRPPVRSDAAIHLGDVQRPILVGQAADLPVLALDHHEDDGVAPSVHLHDVELRIAGLEVAGCRPQALGPVVVTSGLPAEGVHQRRRGD